MKIKTKIKPILFNTDMVRAILDGRKTVTRQVVKPQPRVVYHDGKMHEEDGTYFVLEEDQNGGLIQTIPSYQPGDILYVRETWYKDAARYMYRADYSDNEKFYRDGKEVEIKWRQSIHMPKEAARIFLRVTGVRVERLQDITEEGVIAEGTDIDAWYEHDEWQHSVGDGCVRDGIPVVFETLKGFFGHTVWDSTMNSLEAYEKYGWQENPFVWVIEFERISREEAD